MSKQQVKLDNWPFKNGEKVKLIWISTPFWQSKKIMIYAYFRANGKQKAIGRLGDVAGISNPTMAILEKVSHQQGQKKLK